MLPAHPHHDGSPLHVPNQAPRPGDLVEVRLRVPASFGPVQRVHVRSLRDAEPHYDEAVLLGTDGGWQWWEAVIQVVNPVTRYRFLIQADAAGSTDPAYWWLNAEGLFDHDLPDAADFRLVAHEPAPEWVHRSVLYQIFPDRFARSGAAAARPVPEWAVPCDWNTTPVQPFGEDTPRQYYGGDLDGVIDRLDHIAALGATVIYLTPVFPARSNHRYDATTFDGVDDALGGDAALIRLVQAAHARGLRVLGDLTTNHSGDAHEWFRRSHRNPAAPESGFYYFSEDNSRYTAWLGVPSLPKFDWSSQELRRRFIAGSDSVVARWLKPPFNLDGWRVDVANMTGRHGSDDYNDEVARAVRQTMVEVNPDAMLLAEATADAAPDFPGDGWHGAMTYSNFTRPLWQWLVRDGHPPVNFFGTPVPGPNRIPAERFLATHRSLAAAFSWRIRTQNMTAINSHDTARAATVMIDGGQEVAAGLMFALPGIPTLFAGDEFGLEGISGEDARTPMPWDDPSRVVRDLRRTYAALAGLRRRLPALTDGGLRWLVAEGDVLVFVREHREGSVLVIAARAAFGPIRLPLELVSPAGGQPAPLYASGPAGAQVDDGVSEVVVSGEGPLIAFWELPGVQAPAS